MDKKDLKKLEQTTNAHVEAHNTINNNFEQVRWGADPQPEDTWID